MNPTASMSASRTTATRLRALPAALVRALDGAFDRAAEQPVVGIAMTPSASTTATAACPNWSSGVARRARGRRAAAAFPTVSLGEVFLNRRACLSQPDGDGHRGDDRRPADGRRSADWRLRQDRAGAADGRGVADLPAIQLVTGR